MSLNAQTKLAEARRLVNAGNLAEAEVICRSILGEIENHAGALFLIGLIGVRVGNFQGAEPYLRAAIKSDPTVPDYYNAHGVALENCGEKQEALAGYRKAITIKPDYPQGHYNLANLLKEMGQVEEAVLHYEKAIQLKPDYAKAYNNLGILLQGIGRAPAAVQYLEKAIAIEPDLAENEQRKRGCCFCADQ